MSMKTWAAIAAAVFVVFAAGTVLACVVSGWFWPIAVLAGAALPAWIALILTDFGLDFFYESRAELRHDVAVAALTADDRRWLMLRGWRP